jgi:hypothetical protein
MFSFNSRYIAFHAPKAGEPGYAIQVVYLQDMLVAI